MEPQGNLMHSFIRDEDGTTNLLATILDPRINSPIQSEFRYAICERLSRLSIHIPPDAVPQQVVPQYLCIDLVVVWGGWILLIENKVRAASITRNQLQRYYDLSLIEMGSGKFLADSTLASSRLAVIYLTPTEDVGGAEFASLQLNPQRDDRKAHLSWPGLLDDFRTALHKAKMADPLTRLIADGCLCVKEILSSSTLPKTAESPHRIEAKSFLDRVQTRVSELLEIHGPFKLSRWKDPRCDQLYGWLGGDLGNVYFEIFEDGSDLAQCPGALIHYRICFWIAKKAPRLVGQEFGECPLENWATILGIPPEQLSSIRESTGVGLQNIVTGDFDHLIEMAISMFCRFMVTFRGFMERKLS